MTRAEVVAWARREALHYARGEWMRDGYESAADLLEGLPRVPTSTRKVEMAFVPANDDLLPCPFCGTPAVLCDGDYRVEHRIGCYFGLGNGDQRTEWIVGPRACLAWERRAFALKIQRERRKEARRA